MTTFDDFLKTGRMGPLATGLTRDAVRTLLGDPSDISVGRSPEIWKYGPIECAFYRAGDGSDLALASIIYQVWHGADSLPDRLEPFGWWPTSATTFEEIRRHLDDATIDVAGGVATGPERSLVLASGVRMTFDDDKLTTVGTSSPRSATSKQLSIAVSEDVLFLVRREARLLGLSAGALCSLWIKERVATLEGQTVGAGQ